MDRHMVEVSWQEARRSFDPQDFLETDGMVGIVGQERAERAIEFGLAMDAHMFLVGPAGTGKRTYIRQRLTSWAASRCTPDDWCYLPQFDREDEPTAVSLPAGQARPFQRDVEEFIKTVHRAVREAFESEAYAHHRQSVLKEFEEKQQDVLSQLEERARHLGFAVQTGPTGHIVTMPLKPDGQPFLPQEFQEVPAPIQKHFQERQALLAEPLEMTWHRLRALEREARLALQNMDQEVARNTARHLVDSFSATYGDTPPALYFGRILEDVLQHVEETRSDENEDSRPWLSRYAVKPVVAHEPGQGAPVIIENNPTYANLFGQIHYKEAQGTLTDGLRGIVSGSVLRANGGYLVLMAEDVLKEPYSYAALKRVLRQGWVKVENAPEPMGFLRPAMLHPEPIPLQVTIILIGSPATYYTLYNLDPDFRRLFKVKADFGADMPATPANIQRFGTMLRQAAQVNGRRLPDPGASARLAEFAAELAEHQDRLSTQLGEVLSVLDEAQVWTASDGVPEVQRKHVEAALSARRERSEGPADLMQRLISDETLLIVTEGAAVGQVNGLAVMSAGDAPFGHPSRITAAVWAGERSIVNIERQTRQSGALHTKGVLTLTGFFSSRFGIRQPMTLSASIAFEQMYDEVDGDSASSAELYALISAVSGIPIDQGIAVTGSVDQYGAVEPIGGVNHKIEGFFKACRRQGLSGKQGVMIPRRNLKNLMVSTEVQDAIKNGQFHLWAVDTVDQGIEILTGVPAGTAEDGPETVMGRISQRLRLFSEVVRPRRDA